MGEFLLVRHGEPDLELLESLKKRGWPVDIVPLSSRGIEQIRQSAELLRPLHPITVISSPMTRALHSAVLISQVLNIPISVEFNLHEWIPEVHDPARNPDPLPCIRSRARAALAHYVFEKPTIVTCHAMVIEALTGVQASYAQIVKFNV